MSSSSQENCKLRLNLLRGSDRNRDNLIFLEKMEEKKKKYGKWHFSSLRRHNILRVYPLFLLRSLFLESKSTQHYGKINIKRLPWIIKLNAKLFFDYNGDCKDFQEMLNLINMNRIFIGSVFLQWYWFFYVEMYIYWVDLFYVAEWAIFRLKFSFAFVINFFYVTEKNTDFASGWFYGFFCR